MEVYELIGIIILRNRLRISFTMTGNMSKKIKKTVVVALGNEFRGDDGAGILFGRKILDRVDIPVIIGGDAPENAVGVISDERPDEIIIVDALDYGGQAGESIVVHGDDIKGAGVSTHGSLGLFLQFLRLSTGADIVVLGFQPGNVDIGGTVTPAVQSAVDDIARKVIQDCGFGGLLPAVAPDGGVHDITR